MRTFNLVKSLSTRVYNFTPSPLGKAGKGLRLLILCLSLATFGVENAWGGATYTSKAKAYSSPTGAGDVYVSNKNQTKGSSSEATNKTEDATSAPNHTYYFYTDRIDNSYTFLGWAETGETNTLKSTTKDNYSDNCTAKKNENYEVLLERHAIYARLIAGSQESGSTINLGDVSVGKSASKEITVKHTHVSNVTATCDDEQFTATVTYTTSYQTEMTSEVSIEFKPSIDSKGPQSSTLEIKGENLKTTLTYTLEGTAYVAPIITWKDVDGKELVDGTPLNVGDLIQASSPSGQVSYADYDSNFDLIDEGEGNVYLQVKETATVGECTIKATIEKKGYPSWTYAGEQSLRVNITNKQKVQIIWNDDISDLDNSQQDFGYTIPLTAKVYKMDGTYIKAASYRTDPASSSVVEIVNGNELKVKAQGGPVKVIAYVNEDDTYSAAEMTKNVTVYDMGDACATTDGPISISLTSSKNSVENSDFSTPGTITVTHGGRATSDITYYEYGKNGQELFKDTYDPDEIASKLNGKKMNPATTKIKFSASVTNPLRQHDITVTITRNTYSHVYNEDGSAISTDWDITDIKPGDIVPKKYKVDYSNVPVVISLAKNDGLWTIDTKRIGKCGDSNTGYVTVKFQSSKAGDFSNTLYFKTNTNDPIATINLTASVDKSDQVVESCNIADSYLTTDASEALAAKTVLGKTDFTFFVKNGTDPNGIVHIDANNVMTFIGSGTATIIAHRDGDDTYNELNAEYPITISKVTPTISTNPTATATITYGQKLSTIGLAGGSATVNPFRGEAIDHTVEGSFAWTNGEYVVVETGGTTHEYDVTFTPSGTEAEMYNTVSGKATVTVNKATPTLEVQNPPAQVFFVNDELTPKLDLVTCIRLYSAADDTSNPQAKSAINYSCNYPSTGIVTDDKKFYATAPDTYTITATAPETNYYNSVEKTFTIEVGKYQPSITWTGDASYPASATGDVDLQLFKIMPEALQSSLTFTTSDASVATIVNGEIHCNKQGTVTITANYEGNANYKSAEKDQLITFVGITDEITWNEEKELNFYAKDQIPSTVAVAKSKLAVTYESKDETIVKVESGTKLSAISEGTVNIIARTQGDSYNAPCVSEVTFTIVRRPQSIKWDQSFVNYVTKEDGTIDVSEALNAVAMDDLVGVPSGCSISYSVPAGQTIAEIKDGKLHLIGVGETKITATASQTSEYETFFVEKMVKVREYGAECESFVLEELDQKAIGSKSGFTYSFNKPGAKLSFKARKGRVLFIPVLDADVKIEGRASEQDNWTQIMTFNLNHTTTEPYDNDINENYRMIRFTTGEDLGNDQRWISEVYITQASYLRTELESKINEKAYINSNYEKEFKVYFSDIPPVMASITNNEGANLTLKPIRVSLNGAAEEACTEATNDCGDYGYYVYQLSGLWEDPHKYEEQITFTTSLGEKVTVGVKLDVESLGTMKFDNYMGTKKWADSRNWSYGDHDHKKLPTASHSVEIDQDVIVDCEANVYNLTIYAHDGVYPEVRIAPQGGLTIHNGGIMVADKCSIVIESSKEKQGYLRVSPKWANGQGERYPLPTATVQLATRGDIEAAQKVDGKQDAQWQYMGFPVDMTAYNVNYITWLYEWNEKQGWIDKKAESDASAEKQAAVAPFTAYALTQYGTPVLEFDGKLINRDVTIPFTYTPDGLGGQNMFANSYPSPIDVKCFTQEDVPFKAGAMDFTFYLYNTGSWANWKNNGKTKDRAAATPGTFTAIPMLGANLMDNYQTLIPSMQGVCVQVYQAGTYINLDYKKHVWYAYERENKVGDMKVDDMNQPLRVAMSDNTSLNAEVEEDMRVRDSIRQAHEKQVQALTHRAQIIVNSENSGSTSVYLLEKADFTKRYDNGYDAPLMGTWGVVNLYTTEEDGLMAVSATDNLDSTFVGFLSGEDTNYELSISSVIGESLQLMDMQTGDVIDIKEGATYSFMATPNFEDDYRFRIFKSETKPIVPTGWTGLGDKAKIWYNKQVLYITDAAANSTASIYTATGELLEQVTFNHNTTISTQDMPEGVYTVRAEDSVFKFFVKH